MQITGTYLLFICLVSEKQISNNQGCPSLKLIYLIMFGFDKIAWFTKIYATYIVLNLTYLWLLNPTLQMHTDIYMCQLKLICAGSLSLYIMSTSPLHTRSWSITLQVSVRYIKITCLLHHES